MNKSADHTQNAEPVFSKEQPQALQKDLKGLHAVETADIRFQLTNALQSSLDLRSTLSYFFEYADKLVECAGLRYENADKNLSMLFGSEAKNSVRYNVSSDEENLGQLYFMRGSKFAETELAFLEMLIGVLFYPLRNALTYKEALDSSLIDALTGMNNRLALNMCAEREIKLAKRHKKAMALIVVDLDHFKRVNDTHGHLAGDAVLKASAKAILSAVRETDQVFRYGGEEFVILLNEADLDNAMMSAERIRKGIEELNVSFEGTHVPVTASLGASSLNERDSFNSLFERADSALYQAKANGRNQAICSQEDREQQIKKIA